MVQKKFLLSHLLVIVIIEFGLKEEKGKEHGQVK